MDEDYQEMGGTYRPFDPGNRMQGFDPSLLHAQSAMPFFSDASPRYTGSANFFGNAGSGEISALMNQLMPFVISKMAPKGSVPLQFFPEQNAYDQIQAQQFYQASQAATQTAAMSDRRATSGLLDGLTRTFTGNLTGDDKNRNFEIASALPQFMPMLTQTLGVDMVDALHGSRGSSAIFGNQLHNLLRTSLDSVSGAVGMSGESAAAVSQGVFEDLFGENYNPARVSGLSAGQAGLLAKELQLRGQLGTAIGGLPIEERLAALPEALPYETFSRIADNLPEIKALGDNATLKDRMDATDRVRATFKKMQDNDDPANPITEASLKDEQAMPGGKDLLRTADSSRIIARIEEMSGATKAMQDIFGDAGNPNAPMSQLVEGLNRLTQGNMASLSPAALENAVRKTQAIAKQTGAGIEAMMALADTVGQLAQKLGVDDRHVLEITQQSTLFAAAARNVGHLDSGIRGQPSAERVVAMDSRLRVAATGSVAANQMGAALRLADIMEADGRAPAADSPAGKYLAAIRKKDRTFDYRTPDSAFLDMFAAEGISPGTTREFMINRDANSSRGSKAGVTDIVRRSLMPRDAAEKVYGPSLARSLRASTVTAGDQLIKDGKADATSLGYMYDGIGKKVTEDIFAMPVDVFNDDEKRQTAIGDIIRRSLTQKLGTPEAADAFIEQSGGLNLLAAVAYSSIDVRAQEDSVAATAPGAYLVYGDHVAAASKKAEQQVIVDTMMSRAMASVGSSSPLRRIADVMQKMGPGGLNAEALEEIANIIPKEGMDAVNPTGPLMVALGLWEKSKELDPSNEEDVKQLQFNTDAVGAISAGGVEARTFLDTYKEDPRYTANQKLQKVIQQAVKPGYVPLTNKNSKAGEPWKPEIKTIKEYISEGQPSTAGAGSVLLPEATESNLDKSDDSTTATDSKLSSDTQQADNGIPLVNLLKDVFNDAKSQIVANAVKGKFSELRASVLASDTYAETVETKGFNLLKMVPAVGPIGTAARALGAIGTAAAPVINDQLKTEDTVGATGSGNLQIVITGTLEELGGDRSFSIRGTGNKAAAAMLPTASNA